MKNYVIYEIAGGRITQAGQCQDEAFAALSTDTTKALEIPEPVDPNLWRVVNDQLEPLPPIPNPSYVFDYTSNTWRDPRTIEQARTEAWSRVKDGRDAAATRGFDWNGYLIQADTRSLINLNTVVNSYANVAPSSGTKIDWTTADNQTITVTTEQLKEIAADAGFFVESLHKRAQEKRQIINSSTSLTFLDSIEF